MNTAQVYLLILWSVKLVVVATSVALIVGLPVKAVQLRWVSLAAGLLVSLFVGLRFLVAIPPDYDIFWRAGRDVWRGVDPYSPERFAAYPFLNPPTALPLFALFAVLPFGPSFILFTLVNVSICLCLPGYCMRVLTAQGRIDTGAGRDEPAIERLSWPQLVGLSAALAVSDSFVRGLYMGQLGLLAAFVLIAALDFQARGRPILAGVFLALGTIKVGTMIPFLLLFHRKDDLPSWLSLGCVCLGLCLATGRPEVLPGRLANMLGRIEALGAPGKVNDYSFEGTQDESLIGFDHLFYRLGLRSRPLIRVLGYVGIATLGPWTAWQVCFTRLPRGAACSLVALYSMLFLYHRDYDSSILVLPMVYCAARARTAPRAARSLLLGCTLAIYPILYLNNTLLMHLSDASRRWGITGRLVQATLLPYATWLILLDLAGLVIAVSLARRTTSATRPQTMPLPGSPG